MSSPFQTVPQRLSALVGPHELLDIIKAAEDAETEARKARRRADEAVGRFSTQRGYRMHLTSQEARRLAIAEAAAEQPMRKRRAA